MKKVSVEANKGKASDSFSYILVFCPNFPPATRSTTKKAFEDLINQIDVIMRGSCKETTKQWLRICLTDIRQSWKSYDEGNIREGRKLIQRAEEHFNNAFSKKSMEARFVGQERGAALDNNAGFPE
jgi:hypothetical protein